ncbi:MAG: inositol 2-dehydrogenase [Alphaproteobacteria bacterium]
MILATAHSVEDTTMINMAVLGCGRIGRMHAANIERHDRLHLAAVFDIHQPSATEVAEAHGTTVAASIDAIMADSALDGILIASSTDTHADLIEAGAAAGKAIFCEKPIDLSIERVNRCAEAIAGYDVPIQIGFNRRFDPGHRRARDNMRAGDIGDLHQVIITSRDPEIPPRSYLEVAGGLMRDMTIHDFDLARFMLDDEPVEVFAVADALADKELGGAINEVDSAMIIMRTADGKMCHINNSRAAVYGYDQRVELMGNNGMLLSDNRKPHELRRYGAQTVEAADPYLFFFIERYHEAFMAELDAFADAVSTGKPCEVGFEDGRKALRLAEAAYLSKAERRIVRIEEIA